MKPVSDSLAQPTLQAKAPLVTALQIWSAPTCRSFRAGGMLAGSVLVLMLVGGEATKSEQRSELQVVDLRNTRDRTDLEPVIAEGSVPDDAPDFQRSRRTMQRFDSLLERPGALAAGSHLVSLLRDSTDDPASTDTRPPRIQSIVVPPGVPQNPATRKRLLDELINSSGGLL